MSRRMHSPLIIRAEGPGVFSGGVRLPPGERYQVIHFAAGAIRYLYGGPNGIASPPLYAAVVGASPIMVHPGDEVRIQVLQALNTECFIHVVGMIEDKPGESGWERQP